MTDATNDRIDATHPDETAETLPPETPETPESSESVSVPPPVPPRQPGFLARLFMSRKKQQALAVQNGYLEMVDLIRAIRSHLDRQEQVQTHVLSMLEKVPGAMDRQHEVMSLFKQQLESNMENDRRLTDSMGRLSGTLDAMNESQKMSSRTITDLIGRSRESEQLLREVMRRAERRMTLLIAFFVLLVLGSGFYLVHTLNQGEWRLPALPAAAEEPAEAPSEAPAEPPAAEPEPPAPGLTPVLEEPAPSPEPVQEEPEPATPAEPAESGSDPAIEPPADAPPPPAGQEAKTAQPVESNESPAPVLEPESKPESPPPADTEPEKTTRKSKSKRSRAKAKPKADVVEKPAEPESAPAPEAENTPDNPAANDSTPTPLDITLSQLETAIDDSRPEPFKTANKASVTLP